MTLKVEIDVDLCMASGACAAEAPAIFDVPGDHAVLIGDPDTDLDATIEALRACPVQAIRAWRDGAEVE